MNRWRVRGTLWGTSYYDIRVEADTAKEAAAKAIERVRAAYGIGENELPFVDSVSLVDSK
jgi:hypothetical protein